MTIGAISPKAVDDVAVEEVREAGPLELTGVAAVILKAEGEQAIEIAEKGRRIDVAPSDVGESAGVMDELGGEGRGISSFFAETACGGAMVELCAEDASV